MRVFGIKRNNMYLIVLHIKILCHVFIKLFIIFKLIQPMESSSLKTDLTHSFRLTNHLMIKLKKSTNFQHFHVCLVGVSQLHPIHMNEVELGYFIVFCHLLQRCHDFHHRCRLPRTRHSAYEHATKTIFSIKIFGPIGLTKFKLVSSS